MVSLCEREKIENEMRLRGFTNKSEYYRYMIFKNLYL